MSRTILAALFGFGMAGLSFAMPTGAEDGSDVPLEKRGMILGTMVHLKGVKLRAVAKLPDYIVNNPENEPEVSAIVEFLTKYLGTTQLDLLIEYPPITKF
jgi:hypothetical protein